jgi:uncharacterized protein
LARSTVPHAGVESSERIYTIAIEEHYASPAIMARTQDVPGPLTSEVGAALHPALVDLGPARLAAMDEAGIDFQVLSHTAPGVECIVHPDATALARAANDSVLEAVSECPHRLGGFATLPISDPDAAAAELARCLDGGMLGALVSGGVDGRFLDDPSFDAILSVAASHRVPLYVHPGIPPEEIRRTYFSGFSDAVNRMFSTAAWGWHSETAVHVLRLVLAGVFDRHPDLQVVIGHMGEMLPVMLDRSSALLSPLSGLPRTVREYVTEQVSITIAGVYNLPAFNAAVASIGIDRVMFSTDYPYGPSAPAMQFARTVPLAPADRRRFMGENAAGLLGLTIPVEMSS